MENQINVNVRISFDNINIVATSRINNQIISIHDENVNVNDIQPNESVKQSIKNVLKNIEAKTSRRVEEINIIFDDFIKKSELVEVTNKILEDCCEFGPNGKVLDSLSCRNMIDNMISKVQQNDDDKDKILISVIPFRFFYVESGYANEREFIAFPINKKVLKLRVNYSIIFINKESYAKILDLFSLYKTKIKNITLESQLSIYNGSNLLSNANNNRFVMAIRENKTLLVTVINNVAIMTDVLKFSFNDLLKKIEDQFNISTFEAEHLINCYSEILDNVEEKIMDEIVYSSSNIDSSKPIRRSELADVVKSFLKSICAQANDIIEERPNNFNADLKIIGKLSTIESIDKYCTKYFKDVNIIQNDKKNLDSIYSWNESYVCNQNYWTFMNVINNKMNEDAIHYNSNEHHRNNSMRRERKSIETISHKKTEALLA